MKKYFTLIEVERDLGVSVQELIQFAAHDELTISVIAQDWSGSSIGSLADTILTGPVNLVASDLLQSLGADHTTVRKVQLHDEEAFVTLDPPVNVQRGIHFVTANELKRFRTEHCGAVPEPEIPPYLDPSHPMQSYELQTAIHAWLALYVAGEFKQPGLGHKIQIGTWLRKHHAELTDAARERIATVVNPNKVGGNRTRTKSKPTNANSS